MHYQKGTVISAKGDKTVTVAVSLSRMHPKYRKSYKVTRKFYAHDEQNQYKAGDQVTIRSVRPISKMKHWLCIPAESVAKLKNKTIEKQAKKATEKKELIDKMVAKLKKGEDKAKKPAPKKAASKTTKSKK